MENWDLQGIDVAVGRPQIVATNTSRAIVVALAAGGSMPDHQVHERAWVTVISGTVRVGPVGEAPVTGSEGHLFAFEPAERHRVDAVTDARLLLLLSPWPGDGHPGETPLEAKRNASQRAAEINGRA